MNEILDQIILASRRRSPKGWGNILFIVFLAIFWAISGILKAKKNAQEKKAGGQPLGQKPGSKPVESKKETPKGPFQQIRAVVVAELEKQRELQSQQRQRKVVRPQPAARKVVSKTESAARIPASKPAVEARLARPTPQVKSEIQELPEFTDKAVKKLKDKRISAPSEIPQAKHLAEILLDYSDPDELKRAILHYEILGRPLALRGSSGSVIGL
ncbi:MAG: hypothetical protein ACYTDW_05370 [Planctomycetota bacterium]|jgi:hypothetical protein